ncbi:MAG: hypothetical protein ACRELY_31345 [Polyangiaceae bacterium]
MRNAIAALLATCLVACAHELPPAPVVAEVPMYTPAEWTDMTSATTVPEIADSTVLASSIGSSRFSMHIHTHGFHMHMHH